MEPIVVVLAFAAMAGGIAVFRVVAENLQSNRAIRPVARRRDRHVHSVGVRFYQAADTLRHVADR